MEPAKLWAEGLFGAGEALVDCLFGFGLLLTKNKGASRGDVLVVGAALFDVDQGFVCNAEAAHQILEQGEPLAVAHVAVGVKLASHAMETFFDLLGRRSGGDAEEFVVRRLVRQFEQGADFFFKFLRFDRFFASS
jgi:hypothetical protein